MATLHIDDATTFASGAVLVDPSLYQTNTEPDAKYCCWGLFLSGDDMPLPRGTFDPPSTPEFSPSGVVNQADRFQWIVVEQPSVGQLEVPVSINPPYTFLVYRPPSYVDLCLNVWGVGFPESGQSAPGMTLTAVARARYYPDFDADPDYYIESNDVVFSIVIPPFFGWADVSAFWTDLIQCKQPPGSQFIPKPGSGEYNLYPQILAEGYTGYFGFRQELHHELAQPVDLTVESPSIIMQAPVVAVPTVSPNFYGGIGEYGYSAKVHLFSIQFAEGFLTPVGASEPGLKVSVTAHNADGTLIDDLAQLMNLRPRDWVGEQYPNAFHDTYSRPIFGLNSMNVDMPVGAGCYIEVTVTVFDFGTYSSIPIAGFLLQQNEENWKYYVG